MRRVAPSERPKEGARPLVRVFGWVLYRDSDIELIPPPPPPRCQLCGNRTREVALVASPKGYEKVCRRCVEVVKDRTRNMAHGRVLLDGSEVIWR